MNDRTYTTPLKTSSVAFRAVGVWRAVVTSVVGTQVNVVVPRLSGELEYGPLDVVAHNDTSPPAVGDPVLVGFVEGRQDDLVVVGTVRTALPVDTDPFNDFASVSYTASTTTAQQVIDSVTTTVYRSIRWTVQASSSAGHRVCEVVAVHDGTSVSFTEYAVTVVGTDPVTSFDVDVIGTAFVLEVTPATSPVTFKVSRAAIPV